MGGNTGNIRTLRNQSGSNGSRSLGSILASDSGAGAGSIRRLYGWYRKNKPGLNPFTQIFGINRSQIKTRGQWSMIY